MSTAKIEEVDEKLVIEAGKSYWISFAAQQFRAAADREALIPGWWWCKADDGTLAMFPESAFLYRVAPPPDEPAGLATQP